MKTIDEILVGLWCCGGNRCDVNRCPYSELDPDACFAELRRDAREALVRAHAEADAKIAEEARLRDGLEGLLRGAYPAEDQEAQDE